MNLVSWFRTKWGTSERFQFANYLIFYFLIITIIPFLMKGTGLMPWALWPVILLAQNFAFTFVSRARSSGSLLRHAKASLMSNGIWIVSQAILFTKFFDYLTGKHGLGPEVLVQMVYTITTMSGSLYAHYHALKTEKGKNAVGASKLYAQIKVEDWTATQEAIKKLARIEGLAQNAYDMALGVIPDNNFAVVQARQNPVAGTVSEVPRMAGITEPTHQRTAAEIEHAGR